MNRALFVGMWSLSSLPFSLTAIAWVGSLGFFVPFVIAAQSLLMAGFVRQALRSVGRDSLEAQPGWANKIYPAGIIMLVIFQFLLGLVGWDGALQVGAWLQALVTVRPGPGAGLGDAAHPHPQPNPRALGQPRRCRAIHRIQQSVGHLSHSEKNQPDHHHHPRRGRRHHVDPAVIGAFYFLHSTGDSIKWQPILPHGLQWA